MKRKPLKRRAVKRRKPDAEMERIAVMVECLGDMVEQLLRWSAKVDERIVLMRDMLDDMDLNGTTFAHSMKDAIENVDRLSFRVGRLQAENDTLRGEKWRAVKS